MQGKLYGVGVGPGDPELLTIKAVKVLEKVDIIAIPKTSEDKESTALNIIKDYIKEQKKILELTFPMSHDAQTLEKSWHNAQQSIKEKLDEGLDVAFVTLGDPTVYSTYMYIHKVFKKEGYNTEIIPGITSFCASAAKSGVSLGENKECIAIVPSSYDCVAIDNILETFDNIVLMKVSRHLKCLKEKLSDKGLLENSVLVSKCGFKDEIIEFDLDKACEKELSYFTTLIVKKNGV